MGVSEEDVKEEEQIQEDFKKAKEIYQRIVKQFSNRLMQNYQLHFSHYA